MNDTVKQAKKATDFFDIKKLFKVMDANGWKEGKNFMQFWAAGKKQIAAVDPSKGKSTVGANVNSKLRIYTIDWNWLTRFPSANTKYNELLKQRANNAKVRNVVKLKYGNTGSQNKISEPFNEWLVDGLQPAAYLHRIKNSQLQYINVNPFDMNGGKFNDLIAAINGFNFFVMYKGSVINGSSYRMHKMQADKEKICKPSPLTNIPPTSLPDVERLLKNPAIKKIVYVSHIGVYAGDIYEFNGSQYLATWNIVKNTVELSKWDYLWGTSDTDDPEDLAITNNTYRIYRDKTGMGGDFLALTPIKLIEYPMIIPVH